MVPVLDRPPRARTSDPVDAVSVDALHAQLARSQEAELRWRSIIESPFDFVMILDRDLVIRYINRISFGYKKEHVVGCSTVLDYLAPEYHDEVLTKIRAVFAKGEAEYYEAYSPTPVDRWFLTLVSPFEAGREVHSVSLQSRDITPQKVAERDLAEVENRFLQLAENIEDCFYLLDVFENRVEYVSPAVEKVMGLSGSELHKDAQAWMRVVHPDDRDLCQRGLQRMSTQGYDFGQPAEYRIVRNGETRWVQHRAFPVRNRNQGVMRIAGIVSDITARKEAAQQLLEAEARYRRLLETLPIVSYVAQPGADHVARWISPQIEWTLGYTQEEWTSNPALWLDRIHPQDRDAARQAMETFQRTGEPMRVEYRLLAKDGAPITIREEAALVQFDSKEEPRVHGVLLDVSETMVAKEGRRSALEASAQLVRVQEEERRRLSRELHDEVGQDLTLLRMLLEGIETGDAMVRDDKLRQAKQHVLELMQRMHDLALDLRPSILDDLGLMPALEWLVGRVAQQTGLDVKFEHSGMEGVQHSPEIETGIYRIVQEALTNCVRHAGATHALVRVWRTPAILNLQVEDDGEGFDVDTTIDHDCVGLLGIRERAMAMEAEFELESVPGKGCRLLVQVPVEKTHARSIAPGDQDADPVGR